MRPASRPTANGQGPDACRTIGRMTTTLRPVLLFYGRATCAPCTEARHSLQWILEDRAAHGQLVPVVRDLDVATDRGPGAAVRCPGAGRGHR